MLSRTWAALTAIAMSCGREPPPPPPPIDLASITWPAPVDAGPKPEYRADPPASPLEESVTGKGKTFMVVSAQADATKVGKAILAAGGNAVDAAVATAFALAVTYPYAGNIGGGGFAIVRTAPGKAVALDFREVAPAAATETMYLDQAGKVTDAAQIGYRASGVPGSVAGLHALHAKLGKKPWKELVQPAIDLARDGFALDAFQVASFAKLHTRKKLKKNAATVAIWLDGDQEKAAGAVVKQPDLAKTLERIRDHGPDGFYKGETAKLIVDDMQANGGIITAADLEKYKVVWREPLRFPYRGRSVVSMPPPSSGGIVMAMTAGMLRGFDLSKITWHGTEHVHRLSEVWRRAFSVRNETLGDPEFVKNMPIAKLLSRAFLDKLATTIVDKATPSKKVPELIQGVHTTNLVTVDSSGMAVALTTTLNGAFGSGVTIAGGGFLMNNEMDDFAAKPGTPNMFGLVQGAANKIEPGKRMLSSMAPTIVEDEQGEVVMVVGAAGGPKIITAVWQTISNVIDYGHHADMAVAEARIHQQDLPDLLRLEAGAIDKKTEDALRAKGHTVKWFDERREFGAVTAIVRAASGWEGTADPRGGGAAMGD